ncbi:hypothetical protein ACFPER_02390 [Agromyces aurantiacus]|uniref:Uncharacterized protein n=1 Tax=Agromyces aurantiacus TaxID=165814 RepID=A0ABV9R1B8_9MICO|nr:hypothetical protein [Agromyces aurantiacus]MBM7505936.1 hypothetical protein [Agromyces aurantiacus]
MTETTAATRARIRWGWFIGCIVLGLASILVGLLVAPAADQAAYLAGVLGAVGTTLLLVGVVVLLERRIVDTAVRAVRDAAEEARVRADESVRRQVRDLEDRLADLWAGTATPDDVRRNEEQTRRMTDEFTKRVADEYGAEDAAP